MSMSVRTEVTLVEELFSASGSVTPGALITVATFSSDPEKLEATVPVTV